MASTVTRNTFKPEGVFTALVTPFIGSGQDSVVDYVGFLRSRTSAALSSVTALSLDQRSPPSRTLSPPPPLPPPPPPAPPPWPALALTGGAPQGSQQADRAWNRRPCSYGNDWRVPHRLARRARADHPRDHQGRGRARADHCRYWIQLHQGGDPPHQERQEGRRQRCADRQPVLQPPHSGGWVFCEVHEFLG